MRFSQIIGHDQIKAHLRATVAQDRVSHALLLTGAEGSGALPLALAYAQYLHCRNRTAEDACGVCPECYRMERLEHPDFHFVYPVNVSKEAVAVGRSDDKPRSDQFLHLWRQAVPACGGYLSEQEWYAALGIENQQGIINKSDANELVRKMGLKSFEGGYKTVLIWLPERLNDAAANTLLKLIEEPPDKTLFLLVSKEPEKIMATIRSRTQPVVLAGVEDAVVAGELRARYGLPQPRAEELARLAQGNWARAGRLARGDVSARTEAEGETGEAGSGVSGGGGVLGGELQERFIRLMRLCYGGRHLDLFEWAEEMVPLGREAQKQFCVLGLDILRECYLTGIGQEPLGYVEPDRGTFVRNFAPFVDHRTIEPFVAEFELLLQHIRQNGNPRILFTHFALTLSKILGQAKR